PTRDSHQFPVAADKPGTNRGRQTRTTRKPGTRKPGKPGKPEPGKPGKPGTVTNFPSRPTGELVTVPGLVCPWFGLRREIGDCPWFAPGLRPWFAVCWFAWFGPVWSGLPWFATGLRATS